MYKIIEQTSIFFFQLQTWAAKLRIHNVEMSELSASQILREIRFGHFGAPKTAILS